MTRLPFECQRCGVCCKGKGGIYLEKEEIPAAAQLLDLTEKEFIESFCLPRDGKYEIQTDAKGVCILFGPKGCRIHQAKPGICRQWPFFPAMLKYKGALEEAKLACPGIDPKVSHEDFVAYYETLKAKGEFKE
jgi:hypothetical protein